MPHSMWNLKASDPGLNPPLVLKGWDLNPLDYQASPRILFYFDCFSTCDYYKYNLPTRSFGDSLGILTNIYNLSKGKMLNGINELWLKGSLISKDMNPFKHESF